MTGPFLGGELRPAGTAIAFLRRSLADVRDEIVRWRTGLGQQLDVRTQLTFPSCVDSLDPYEWPWQTELLIDCGAWCMYTNNQIGGGDSSASAGYLGRALACELVQAVHVPKYPPGHAATNLVIQAPDDTCRRVIAAHAEDGRWSWQTYGDPLPFEKVERYTARKIRDRLDRPLLVEYLASYGIRVDDPSFYGAATVVRQIITFPKQRRETAAETRADRGW